MPCIIKQEKMMGALKTLEEFLFDPSKQNISQQEEIKFKSAYMCFIQQEEIRKAVQTLEEFVSSSSKKDIPQYTKEKILFIFNEFKNRPNYKSVFSTYVPKHIRVQKYSNCI